MMSKKKIVLPALLLAVTYGLYGYIDPGTGSYLVQVVIAAVVGASLGIKLFWGKIKSFLGKTFSRKNTSPGEP